MIQHFTDNSKHVFSVSLVVWIVRVPYGQHAHSASDDANRRPILAGILDDRRRYNITLHITHVLQIVSQHTYYYVTYMSIQANISNNHGKP